MGWGNGTQKARALSMQPSPIREIDCRPVGRRGSICGVMFGRNTGEQDAFAVVVDAYQGALLRYVSRLVTHRGGVEDVVQNTFVKCATAWKGEMVPGDGLAAWLYRVAHNEAMDLNRREKRRWSLHRRHAEEEGEEPLAPDPMPGVSDQAAAAAAALAILSERERQLVTLKVFEEKSYKQMAEITGLSLGNVGFILHGAMRKLAEHLRSGERGTDDAGR